jgi:hypothetical protein
MVKKNFDLECLWYVSIKSQKLKKHLEQKKRILEEYLQGESGEEANFLQGLPVTHKKRSAKVVPLQRRHRKSETTSHLLVMIFYIQ